MIISRSHRYIFVHAPKTGGTSLALALEGKLGKADISIGDTPKARQRRGRLQAMATSGRLWKHSGLADIDGLVTRAEIRDFLVFMLVRNPWDRAVSYYHWLRAQRFEHPAVALAVRLEFSPFLHHPATVESFRNSPYGSYVTDADGRECCDLFLRLEHLEDDIAILQQRLGFRLPTVGHSNASARAPGWRRYYTASDTALIAEVCGEDIARFGYEF